MNLSFWRSRDDDNNLASELESAPRDDDNNLASELESAPRDSDAALPPELEPVPGDDDEALSPELEFAPRDDDDLPDVDDSVEIDDDRARHDDEGNPEQSSVDGDDNAPADEGGDFSYDLEPILDDSDAPTEMIAMPDNNDDMPLDKDLETSSRPSPHGYPTGPIEPVKNSPEGKGSSSIADEFMSDSDLYSHVESYYSSSPYGSTPASVDGEVTEKKNVRPGVIVAATLAGLALAGSVGWAVMGSHGEDSDKTASSTTSRGPVKPSAPFRGGTVTGVVTQTSTNTVVAPALPGQAKVTMSPAPTKDESATKEIDRLREDVSAKDRRIGELEAELATAENSAKQAQQENRGLKEQNSQLREQRGQTPSTVTRTRRMQSAPSTVTTTVKRDVVRTLTKTQATTLVTTVTVAPENTSKRVLP